MVHKIMVYLTMDGMLGLIKHGSWMSSGSVGFLFVLELLAPFFSQHSWFNVSASLSVGWLRLHMPTQQNPEEEKDLHGPILQLAFVCKEKPSTAWLTSGFISQLLAIFMIKSNQGQI